MLSFDLSGRVAIVTGGSQGLGKATSIALARQGAHIVAVAREAEPVTVGRPRLHAPIPEAVTEIEAAAAAGSRVLGITADVREQAQVQRIVQETVDTFGRVDILVNVVGGAWGETFRSGALMEMDVNDVMEAYRLNVGTAFMLSQVVQPIMQRQGRGVIVNIASAAGRRASPGQGAYGAAKAGLINLTLTMAKEWGPAIRVNVIAVGGLETPQRPRWSEATTAATLDRSALGRVGTAEEHAGTVVWLASDYAGYITGAVIDAHGGQV